MTEIKHLDELRSYVAKQLGSDFFTDPRGVITRLPTGIYQLDHVLQGGLKEGSVVEFSGPPASGKTYMINRLMAQAQKMYPEKSVVYLDYEISFDSDRAERLGVDVDGIRYGQPENMEDGYNAIIDLLDSEEEFSLIVIDSLSAMLPRKEGEKSVGDSSVALQAMNNTQAMRKLGMRLSKKKTTMVYTNQIRENISGYGPTQKTSGGMAIKHQCNTRLSFDRRKDPDAVRKDGYKQNKFLMFIKLLKHRGAGEEESVELHYIFKDEGIDDMHDLTSHLNNTGVISRAGAWMKISGVDKKVQGKRGIETYLKENPEEISRLVEEASKAEVRGTKEENEEEV